jgi:hypothetical protein
MVRRVPHVGGPSQQAAVGRKEIPPYAKVVLPISKRVPTEFGKASIKGLQNRVSIVTKNSNLPGLKKTVKRAP